MGYTGNGAENGQRCLHCQAYNAECTFLEITKVCFLSSSSLQNFELMVPVLMCLAERTSEGVRFSRNRQVLFPDVIVYRYVDSLENRLKKMEDMLDKVRPLSLSSSRSLHSHRKHPDGAFIVDPSSV